MPGSRTDLFGELRARRFPLSGFSEVLAETAYPCRRARIQLPVVGQESAAGDEPAEAPTHGHDLAGVNRAKKQGLRFVRDGASVKRASSERDRAVSRKAPDAARRDVAH